MATRYARAAITLLICCVALVNSCGAKAANNLPVAVKEQLIPSGPYCGIYCVYAAASLLGDKVEMQSLLDPRYVGSRTGSTINELKRAAEEHNLKATVFEQLNIRALSGSKQLIVLHVMSSPEGKEYDHFVLFVGSSGDTAQLLDAPVIRTVDFSELSRIWDGTGLVIANTPIDTSQLFSAPRDVFAICGGIVSLMVGIGWYFGQSSFAHASTSHPLARSLAQLAVLVLLTGGTSIVYSFLASDGLCANSNTTNDIQKAHFAGFLPKVSAAEVKQHIVAGDTVLIDARLEDDYERGHLPGAISIPVNFSKDQIHSIIVKTDCNAKLIIYCQSRGCPFSGDVAQILDDLGYHNLAIFKGGWAEWQDMKP